ncbi:MAG: hypothetical protein KBG29_07920 [Pseudomonadales bacterium]|nr:hypothetical protein [Pseudomonadales bacterium]
MSTQLADALRRLLNATFHMTDTSIKTGNAFPDAHRAAREVLKAYDASDEARHARAQGYLADVAKRIESLADEIEGEIVENGDFAGYHDPMKACVANLRNATDQLDTLP